MAIPLGTFELSERLGEGGMAEVWSGWHVRERVPVAVKVVTEPDIRRPALHAALRTEVRAMARLDHPRVVMVFDYGEITPEVERASGGKLISGSPYLVMELAAGGTALPMCGTVSWRRAKRILVSVLEALAHAHARGVLHRDVKPSNVLVFDDGVKLSDFGLALEVDPGSSALVDPRRRKRGRVLGTPAYMAPEQFSGAARDYGPATDLYALGCLAYALVTGGPPYGRGHELTLMHELHLEAVIPPLEPRIPVPPGFDAWVHQLLQKRPSRRYQRAADALEALERLGDPAEDGRAPLVDDMGEVDALSSSVVTVCAEVSDGPLSARGAQAPGESIPPPAQPPAFPKDWRSGAGGSTRRAVGLLGAGLGLYGVRPVPLVGREDERDKLWDALRTVSEKREKRLVLLDGPAGCGKSRLAQWLCERAHETGVAEVLRALCSVRGGSAHGLGPMVARYLQAEGLERPELIEHIRRRLGRLDAKDERDVEALAELVNPDVDDSVERSVRFASAAERYVLVARLLRRIARFRPVIVWLEDVHHSHEAVAFAQHLLLADRSASFPVLVLMTARTESLDADPERAREIAACGMHPGAMSLRIGPLPEPRWPQLIERLLRLEPGLAVRVAERTKGNPLFAVQLVGTWIDRGLLEAGPGGFRLRAGAEVELPDELGAVWQQRIERLAGERPASEAQALEIAAMLGEVVDVSEWREACRLGGIGEPAHELVEALIARRLAVPGDGGPTVRWMFVHGMLRESLERRAQDEGRAARHHRLCAEMLGKRTGPGIAERRARHLVAAGRLDEALGPLRDAARFRMETGDYAVAEALLAEREEALVTLRRDQTDVHWAEGWILRGQLAHKRGSFEVGLKWAGLAADAAAEHGWATLRVQGLLLHGQLERMRGQSDRARQDMREAERVARTLGDPRLLAEVLQSLGRVLMHKGQLDAAEGCLAEAHELAQSLDDRRVRAEIKWALAHLLSYRERYDEAFRQNSEALEELAGTGDRWATARCLNTAGEIARLCGRLDEAERGYEQAAEIMNAIGATDSAAVCEANVARTQVERGRYREARVTLNRSLRLFRENDRKNPLAWVYCVLLVCDAGERDWRSWDLHLAEARRLLAETGYLDLDIATVTEMAGREAAAAGAPGSARAALELSLAQWQALSRSENAAQVRAELAALDAQRDR